MRRVRHTTGSVLFDNGRGTWRFLQWVDGKRRSQTLGTKQELPTKAAAWKVASALMPQKPKQTTGITVSSLVEVYRAERMPQRFSTRYSYDQWLTNHILPHWGDGSITGVQPRPVELWLHSLTLSPKSRVHIRGVLHQLWEFAMWRGDVPAERNPMTLVTVRGATKRTKAPRSLTFEEFQKFVSELPEPFRTMALLCLCLGLRISECLALKWADIDWLAGKISVERAIVRQRVDDVKTGGSRKHLSIDGSLLEVLKTWKQTTQFSAPEDWVFASPARLGRLPWSYPRVWGVFQEAAEVAKVGKLATHTMRHSYRSWLDAVGTPVAVQQKLMRHADIRTTMNIYGDVVTNQESEAHSKIVGLALPRA
ncbi:MAG: site-specific integrase [Terriglobales bacterium]